VECATSTVMQSDDVKSETKRTTGELFYINNLDRYRQMPDQKEKVAPHQNVVYGGLNQRSIPNLRGKLQPRACDKHLIIKE